MNWLQALHDTYDNCYGREPDGSKPLMPIAHTTQVAHVEIVLDANGNFRRAEVLEKALGTTLIPCTEGSGGRSGSKPAAHPLCDKLQYVAADFVQHGGQVTSGYAQDPSEPHRLYLELLSAWASSAAGHPKVDAILAYVRKGQVIADLIEHRRLPVDVDGKLLPHWNGDKDGAPALFKVLPAGQAPCDAFVRWRVEGREAASGTWEDDGLIAAWVAFHESLQSLHGFCMVQGQDAILATQHPAKLRNAGDKAKLISANDDAGFTYRGRFLTPEQAVGVGYETTQKAHNALRWLIDRQGSRNGDQAVVSWAASGVAVPNPMDSGDALFGNVQIPLDATAGQAFALRLRKAISGYRQTLNPSERIHVMALDSATPGRMSIAYYRVLRGSEFLDRIESWHEHFAWPQNYGKDQRFVGAPSPKDMAQAAYGRRLDPKLEAATRERLLPCIVDAVAMPRELVESACRRVANRVGMDSWEWEKCLGIACAMFRGTHAVENFDMSLEHDRASRDYLYGRMLAVADNIESFALDKFSESGRETNAARMMHRFSMHPYSTWTMLRARQLEPYISRLKVRAPGFIASREQLLGSIHELFDPAGFTSDAPLSGEFLLGYYCQREELRQKKKQGDESADDYQPQPQTTVASITNEGNPS